MASTENFPEIPSESGDLPGCSIHGIYIRQVNHHCLVAKVLQRSVNQVEMNTLQQQVGGDNLVIGPVIDHCSIITNPHMGAFLLTFNTSK